MNKLKIILSIAVFVFLAGFSGLSIAQNKVVVVPLGSKDLVTSNPITMSHGPGSWTNQNSTVFTQNGAGMSMSGNGFSYLSLTGPSVLGGQNYTLLQVRYCITSVTSGGFLNVVAIALYAGTTLNEVSDSTDRDTIGCYTITTNSTLQSEGAFMFYVGGGGGAGAAIRIGEVRSTWKFSE